MCATIINTVTEGNYEGTVLIIRFNLPFCQAEGSYDQYHHLIDAIVSDVLRG